MAEPSAPNRCTAGQDPAPTIALLVQEIHANIGDLRQEMAQHATNQRVELAKAVADILARSFPEGDPDGHRKFHEAAVRTATERAKFWATMRYELTKYGLFGFLGWAAIYLWQAFLQGPHR